MTPLPLPTPSVTRQTLDSAPGRALKFLRGVSTVLQVRAALEKSGYTKADDDEGWSLLRATGYYRKSFSLEINQFDPGVRAAILALDAWDEDGFAIIRATLGRRFPEQAAVVLDGLTASTGIEAVMGVAMLLERLDTMAASHDKTDKAAIALLGERGITAAVRKELQAHVATAQSGGTVEASLGETAEDAAAADAEQVQALVEMRGWFEEWSAVARAVIKRRDRLILLGLAKAKRKAGESDAAPVSTPAATATPVAPAASATN